MQHICHGINQKFKFIVEDSGYVVIYTNMPTHTRALCARSVDAAKILLISDAKYSTLNEGWLKYKQIKFYKVGF